MAIYLHEQSQTSTTITFFATGTNINYPHKKFQIFIDGYFWDYTIVTGNEFIVENIDRLDLENESYDLYVEVSYDEYDDNWQFEGTSETITIGNGGGGGGGGTTPTYIAYASGNSIQIEIINSSSNCQTCAFLYDSPNASTQIDFEYGDRIVSFSGLSNGTYYVQVDYKDDNFNWETLQNDNTGQTRTQVDIGAPTPSTGGKVYIYIGSQWRTAKPYVYDGTRWRAATPYIYTNSGWRKTE